MSTFVIQPGERLADRYRLDELVHDNGGAALWKATDETLARRVAIWTLADTFGRATDVVRSARAASRVADSRLTQVFDADDSGPIAYVVEEWVTGQSLEDLLAQGPLAPEHAVGLVAEAAEAIATANTANIFHLCLTPAKLFWSAGGAVKVTGLSVDAAINGQGPDGDPLVCDTVGLGRLLYAALTAQWPGSEPTNLASAPIQGGSPCEPRQLQPPIPEALNAVVCRAAFQSANGTAARPLGPLRSPAELCAALSGMSRRVPMPGTPVGGATSASKTATPAARPAAAASPPASPPATPPGSTSPTGQPGSMWRWIALGSGALAVAVAVVVGAWMLGSSWGAPGDELDTGGEDAATDDEDEDTSEEPELDVLAPADVDSFDPGGDGDEHGDRAGEAIDGDSSTGWSTQGYNTADLGGLKDGVGLLVDMGEPVEVSELDILLGEGGGGTDLEVRVGDDAELEELSPVHTETGATGELPVTLSEPAEGQYVLLWLTELPSDGSDYRATIHDVELRGNM